MIPEAVLKFLKWHKTIIKYNTYLHDCSSSLSDDRYPSFPRDWWHWVSVRRNCSSSFLREVNISQGSAEINLNMIFYCPRHGTWHFTTVSINWNKFIIIITERSIHEPSSHIVIIIFPEARACPWSLPRIRQRKKRSQLFKGSILIHYSVMPGGGALL